MITASSIQAVGLEAFGSGITSKAPDDINDIQRTVLTRILTYLNFVHHKRLTDTETVNEDFQISIDVAGDTADVGSGETLLHDG